jgi:hypothetical protein
MAMNKNIFKKIFLKISPKLKITFFDEKHFLKISLKFKIPVIFFNGKKMGKCFSKILHATPGQCMI